MNRLILFLSLSVAAFASDDTVTLPTFSVVSSTTGELVDSSIFGDSSSYLDTPRLYTAIGPATLDTFNIGKIDYLQSFDSSTQTPGLYGYVSTVSIRGDMSELYQNGQRRTNNAAGFAPSLNGVEQVDVIKGAAPITFGPGFYSGGYLNMVSKRALSAPMSILSLTLGTLNADHSYLNTSVSIDENAVISDTISVRASYQGRVDNTFYRAGRDDSQDIYLTLHQSLTDAALDIYVQHSWQAIPQIEGINHPTQSLIDTRLYHGVFLSPTANLVSAGDFSNADVTTVQAIYGNRAFRSYTLAEYINRRRFNAFAYLEWARQLTIDQRLEYHHETDRTYSIIGTQFRYEYRQSFTNYFNAFFDDYDITVPGVRDATLNPAYYPGSPGPNGRLFFGPLDGNTDTTESRLYQFAPFYQQRVKLGRWQVLYGARADGYRVFVTDPLTHSISDDPTTYSTSYNANLMYTVGNTTLYGGYSRLSSVSGTVSGGGIVFAPDLRINKDNLRSINRLYEVGIRYDSVMRAALTAFWQERQQPDLYAYKPNDLAVRGIEASVYRGWGIMYTSVAGTYAESNFINSLPFEFAPTVSKPGDYRVPGQSRLTFVSTIGINTGHWGAALNGRWQSEQAGNTLQTYHIPAQYNLDMALSYHRLGWDISVNAGNLTNTWQWVHNGDQFGDNAVIHHAPMRNVSITVRVYR